MPSSWACVDLRRERREDQGEEEDIIYYVHERVYWAFRRNTTLPEGTNRSKIGASFEDGLLEITVEEATAWEPERIEIREGSGASNRGRSRCRDPVGRSPGGE